MASPENRHGASCIGTLSSPMKTTYLLRVESPQQVMICLSRKLLLYSELSARRYQVRARYRPQWLGGKCAARSRAPIKVYWTDDESTKLLKFGRKWDTETSRPEVQRSAAPVPQ